MNKNSLALGLLLSTLLPLLIFVVAFLYRFQDIGYMNVLMSPMYQPVFPKMFSLCVYPNGLIFFYYIRTNHLLTMRGMLIGTVAMALIVLGLYLAFR